ncbi:kinase [Candidatus Omnitrophota bacterium]
MIISRTPFRISFFGGGTDYPGWYKDHPGAVLSASIDKYCYISCRLLPPFFKYKYRIVYTNREEVNKVSHIQHPSVRETLTFLNEKKGLHIHHDADLPARTGLGSSSTFTVGLLHALYALRGKIVSKKQLALEAIHIEQNLIKEHVGSQDQTVAAFGGFNKIEFKPENIEVHPITISLEKKDLFSRHIMMYFTGFSRIASDVARTQIMAIPRKKRELHTMYQFVEEAVKILNNKRPKFTEFGKLLHENWKLKKSLTSKISTSYIDSIYNTARKAGATGGKLLGAGGGGFMIFFVKPSRQPTVKAALKKLLYVPVKLEFLGSQIVYFRPDYNFDQNGA